MKLDDYATKKYKKPKYSDKEIQESCYEYGKTFGYLDMFETIDMIEKSNDLKMLQSELKKQNKLVDFFIVMKDYEDYVQIPNVSKSWETYMTYFQKELNYKFDDKELGICKKSFYESYPYGVRDYITEKFKKIK